MEPPYPYRLVLTLIPRFIKKSEFRRNFLIDRFVQSQANKLGAYELTIPIGGKLKVQHS